MSIEDHRVAVLRALEQAYLEVFPAAGVAERLEQMPAGAYVAITCSPTKGIHATLELAEGLARRSLRLIPHISARLVIDEAHLKDILARLGELQIGSVFVPGGDVAVPAGKFDSSLQVLEAMAEIGHRFTDIGVAAYPEGHPFIGAAALLDALQRKQRFATYLVTQMCFDAATILDWLARIRAADIRLPVWVGLPGAVARGRLLATSVRIGVGESVRFLRSQRRLLRALLTGGHQWPEALLHGLAPALDDPARGIAGFHLYSFNDIEHTERWRTGMIARLSGGPAAR